MAGFDSAERIFGLLSQPLICLRVTSILLSVALTHSLCEKLASAYSASGREYHSWKLLRVQVGSALHRLPVHLQFLTSDRWYRLITIATLVAAIAMMIVSVESWYFSMVALICAAAMYYLEQRNLFGIDGTHHMLGVGSISIAVASLFQPGSVAFNACLWYLAIQCIFSYFLAGVAKMFGSMWRDGTAVAKILGTNAYGRPRVSRFLESRQTLGKTIAYATCFFELAFPVILVLPCEGVVALMAISMMFHLGTAIFMGLGNFCLAWVVGYPALVYCWTLLWGTTAIVSPSLS